MNYWADEQNGQKHITSHTWAHTFFQRGEELQYPPPPQMALGEGILFPFYGRGKGGRKVANLICIGGNQDFC